MRIGIVSDTHNVPRNVERKVALFGANHQHVLDLASLEMEILRF